MIIKNIKINNFGNIKDKEINLENKINIIYGENEKGKSTLLKFIPGILYGLSRNKNGKDLPDYEKFKPWEGDTFSGKMAYSLNNKNTYEIFRDFNKKNPEIYNENGEDITKTYNINKQTGSEFFYEQTGIDEETFFNTAAIEQEQTKLNKGQQNSLIQKLTNLISTGDDNISFKKSIEKLNKKIKEEVGSDRTDERPINIVQENLRLLNNEKNNLEEFNNKKYEIEELNVEIQEKINNKKILIELIKEIKKNKEQEQMEQELININVKTQEETANKINNLNNKLKENKQEEKNMNLIPFYISIVILTIINILLYIFNQNILIDGIITVFTLIFAGVYFNKINKQKNQQNAQNSKITDIKKEIEILEKNKLEKSEEISNLENNLKIKTQEENQKIKINYSSKINNNTIENLLEKSNIEISNKLDTTENEFKDLNIKIHELELDKRNILPKLDNLVKIQENIIDLETQKAELISLSNSINIAKDTLENAYEEMKSSITPEFTEQLSSIAGNISSNKYKNIKFNDEDGLIVEKEDGQYINSSLLSIGTIDQMYLSLRLSMLEQISEETMPIILDEAFAYYDNERLKNILEYLNSEKIKNQIIILTCSKRETEILNKLNIKYNLINI